MNSKIANSVFGDNDKLWSIIENDQKRVDHLNQLYKNRASRAWVMIILFISVILGMILESLPLTVQSLLFLSLFMMAHLDAEAKIRIIRLYELLSSTDKKI